MSRSAHIEFLIHARPAKSTRPNIAPTAQANTEEYTYRDIPCSTEANYRKATREHRVDI